MGKTLGYIKVTPFELASESPIFWDFLVCGRINKRDKK